jgi:hypothetical protein
MPQPSPPSAVIVQGTADDGSTSIATKDTDGFVAVSAVIDDPDAGQKVRLVVRYSTDRKFAHYKTIASSWGGQAIRRTVGLSRLSKNTHYFMRLYTQDRGGWYSDFNSVDFWTDRYPGPPTLVSPADNLTFDAADAIVFDWVPVDDDETADPPPSNAFRFRWRVAGTPLVPAGPWSMRGFVTSASTKTWPGGTFKARTNYEWQVQTRDPQNQWGAWSLIRSFSTLGVTKVPLPLFPASDIAVATDEPSTFKWQFRDPVPTATQGNADLRYRVAGTETWITVTGSALTDREWTFPEDTFAPGYRYEWQVLTYRSSSADIVSDWSNSAYFWTILTPGSLADLATAISETVRGQLGEGDYRAFIFDRGGLVQRGEITAFTKLHWSRLRDDLSPGSVAIENYDSDLGDLLSKVHSWMHELVIYRDDERVFEGPIVHRTMQKGKVTLSARDVMGYVYRRILRQGYNDSYHKVDGVQLGLKTITERAGLIIINALSYADPNVLPYLTVVQTGEDAQQSRIVPDYSKTAWQEIDDMAANAGLDYTTSGRRIILWDTHHPLGVLPEMRDGDFTDPPVVTEYGMSMANFFAVTDGNGNWGHATPLGTNSTTNPWHQSYGPIEQLASSYGDAAVVDTAELTPQALAVLVEDLRAQARRNIANRWPTPLVARVPDNSGLSPHAPVSINQLVPGVWIPLRVEEIVQPFAQMQKLDTLNVTVEDGKETVAVVLSPAPLSSQDPDGAGEEDGGEGEDTG